MYKEYFGFKEPPFSIAPDPRYLYMSGRHREAFAHLLYGVKNDGGFVLLTGEVGTGKTTICRCLLEQAPGDTEIAFVLNPKVTVEELLATVCDEFRVSYPAGNTSIKVFVDSINRYLLDAHAQGRKAVLIIDEAQNLSPDVLEQIRLLTNLETDKRKLLQIIMLGQPELLEILARPEMRQLEQRITARYHLGPLKKEEVGAYVAHRLTIAGLQKQLFPASCLGKLYALSNGVPRLINVICDRALLGAYAQGKEKVDVKTLRTAAREIFGEKKNRKQPLRMVRRVQWIAAGLLALIGVGAATGAVYYYNRPPVVLPVQEEAAALPPETEEVKKDVLLLDEPELETVLPQDDVPLTSLAWPSDQPIVRSRTLAFKALFQAWGVQLARQNGDVCNMALFHGLRCLSRQDGLSKLRSLNRPAVLLLVDADGKEFYAALVSLQNDVAVFMLGTESRRVSVEEIALRWTGSYTLLWRPPKGYVDSVRPGHKGAEVGWIARQLASVRGGILHETVLDYDDALIKQVKEFQLGEGLLPDGIAGVQTLIHLNAAAGNDVPKLIVE